MELGLREQVILVSGAAQGIGQACAQLLLAESARLVLVDRQPCTWAESDSARVLSLQAELAEPGECQRVVTEAVQQFGRLDGLVNNAGRNDSVGLATGGIEQFWQSLRQNLGHYYELAHHALPELKKSQGSVVNIVSKVALTGQGHTSGYAAANGGRAALTREWAVELAPWRVRVNAVVVAECWTPMYAAWLSSLPDPVAERERIAARVPFEHRFTTGTEIAHMVAFLLSSCSSHTTGQLVHVDGGYVHLDRAAR